MSEEFYRNVILVGDGIYADIATCYLANQLCPIGVNVYRFYDSSITDHTKTINTDHSVHVLNEDLGFDFTRLSSDGVLIPKLVNTASILQKPAYFESYSHLKDDLAIPHYQVMVRLIHEGVAKQLWEASPLVALHNENKFHPALHQFYRNNIRPYGAEINVHAYSEILNSKSLALGVKFLEVSDIEIESNDTEKYISSLRINANSDVRDAFYIDMTADKRLNKLISTSETINIDSKYCGFSYSSEPWIGNCLALGEAAMSLTTRAPVNYFEWLYKSLVRFVDFFPSAARQKFLAKEYNRLQGNDNAAVADFLQTYYSLVTVNNRELLAEKLQYRINLFAESCQLSEEAADWAYSGYWPTLMIAAGVTPRYVPRRVQEIPLKYLIDWYNQRLHNIGTIVSRSFGL